MHAYVRDSTLLEKLDHGVSISFQGVGGRMSRGPPKAAIVEEEDVAALPQVQVESV